MQLTGDPTNGIRWGFGTIEAAPPSLAAGVGALLGANQTITLKMNSGQALWAIAVTGAPVLSWGFTPRLTT